MARGIKKIIDISVALGDGSIDYPGDTPFSYKTLCSLRKNDPYDLTALSMSAHSGTHLDFPSHFLKNGRNTDGYPVSDFILDAVVADIRDKKCVKPEEVERISIPPGGAVLFKTMNSRTGRSANGEFYRHFVHLTAGAAEICMKKKARLVGFDYITIDRYGESEFPAHASLMKKNILILEGLNLRLVRPGWYRLICLPLKLKSREAAPARAILVKL